MLLHDPFAGHRDWETGEPLLAQSDVFWTEWDYALADAVTFMQDHTNEHGHLVWEQEDPRVTVVARRKIDRAQAAIEKKTKGSDKNPYKPKDGEKWYTELRLPDGGDWPTFDEWYERQMGGKEPTEDEYRPVMMSDED